MDVTAISGLPEVFPRNYGPLASYRHGAVNTNMTAILGRRSDALSAVKLDPAVLEAQVTVSNTSSESVEKSTSLNVQNLPTEKELNLQSKQDFRSIVMKQQEALLSLNPQQLELLMKFTNTLRRQRQVLQNKMECSFCKNNGKSVSWYSSHCLKDTRGRVKCPVLRTFRCHVCGATGDHAHTIKYCPHNTLLDVDYWSRADSV